jgi:CheY-like chemotaxis protein
MLAMPVLIADDYQDDVDLFKIALQQTGVTNPVYVVHDGDEVINYLQGRGAFADRVCFPLPRVLFLDLKMPQVDGFEVLRWLKENPQFDELLVVVLSGAGEAREINQAYQLGADTFIVKPFRREDIESLVKNHREHWHFDPQTRQGEYQNQN